MMVSSQCDRARLAVHLVLLTWTHFRILTECHNSGTLAAHRRTIFLDHYHIVGQPYKLEEFRGKNIEIEDRTMNTTYHLLNEHLLLTQGIS